MLTELFLKGRLRQNLSLEETRSLEASVRRTVALPPRKQLIERGQRIDNSYYLVEGAMLRYVDNRKGERQLVSVAIAGDFVDLHGYPMKRLDHAVGTLTSCVLAEVPHSAITDLINKFPHLGRAMWFSTLLDAAMHREWIFRLGRLNAESRIAHLICELITRLRFVDMFDGRNFPVPLLQRDYAEACGITPVHANRSFKSLRERGALILHGEGRIEILDEAMLAKLAEFEGDYLYGSGELQLGELTD
ncbi:Crp/Fnr family transcriptional regulator [Allopontixanthobacter sediminis]|uniref:Helix-turn-helix domain-containing protein n=1 Tax=Allopontixanthobacter sediminis TaxID=1689985 RepID=A0A845AXD2_9SPHN|nr:Crp/Fnr family transcriptional regulator [Allopontixanthobacter sediminis]MXP42910.1 helix-turn-helix domain-containing protein [Allopontixanthobacter sediminis]